MELNPELFILKQNPSKKQMEFDKWSFLCTWFCYYNNHHSPTISISNTIHAPARYFIKSDEIKINIDKCEYIKDKRYGNFIASPNDCSVGGAMCHEIGHFCHESMTDNVKNKLESWISDARTKEKAVNPYASSNIHEDIAETFRLFIMNPDLLKLGRPIRYDIMQQKLSYKPIHHVSYDLVLKNAGSEILKKCNDWIKQLI